MIDTLHSMPDKERDENGTAITGAINQISFLIPSPYPGIYWYVYVRIVDKTLQICSQLPHSYILFI